MGCLVLAGLVSSACSVGHGEGELSGTLQVPGCKDEGYYLLKPDSFFSQAVEELLSIRVQRGGDIEIRSDGLAVGVSDSTAIKQNYLNTELDLSAADADTLVHVTAYFNDTCPPERDKIPAVMEAVSGSIRFEQIYAPQVSERQVRIRAVLTDVRFEDSKKPDERYAELSGFFDFLYQRGSPAQHFP